MIRNVPYSVATLTPEQLTAIFAQCVRAMRHYEANAAKATTRDQRRAAERWVRLNQAAAIGWASR